LEKNAFQKELQIAPNHARCREKMMRYIALPIGVLSLLISLFLATVTIASNNYGPLIATTFGVSALSIACFFYLLFKQQSVAFTKLVAAFGIGCNMLIFCDLAARIFLHFSH
jgi:hypothetical protein